MDNIKLVLEDVIINESLYDRVKHLLKTVDTTNPSKVDYVKSIIKGYNSNEIDEIPEDVENVIMASYGLSIKKYPKELINEYGIEYLDT